MYYFERAWEKEKAKRKPGDQFAFGKALARTLGWQYVIVGILWLFTV